MDHLVDFLLNFSGPTPYLIIFLILLLCGLGLPIPEDITLIAGGLMSYYTVTNVWVMTVISFLGVMLGDSIIFFLGVKYGRMLSRKWLFKRMLSDEALETARVKFNTKGEKLLFAARFMPGLRAPIFFSAGLLHVPFHKFLIYDGGAALISVPLIVGTVYYFGDQMNDVVEYIKRAEHGILAVIVLIIMAVFAKWLIAQSRAGRAGLRSTRRPGKEVS